MTGRLNEVRPQSSLAQQKLVGIELHLPEHAVRNLRLIKALPRILFPKVMYNTILIAQKNTIC